MKNAKMQKKKPLVLERLPSDQPMWLAVVLCVLRVVDVAADFP